MRSLAAIDSLSPNPLALPLHTAALVESIVPAVRRVAGAGDPANADSYAVGREHLRDTISDLLRSSELISDAVAAGTLGVVGANYRLLEGRVVPDVLLGLTKESK